MQVSSWPEGPTAPGASDSGSVASPQSQADEQEPIMVLLGDAGRTFSTVSVQTRAALQKLISAQHQSFYPVEESSKPGLSSGLNKMQEPLLIGHRGGLG